MLEKGRIAVLPFSFFTGKQVIVFIMSLRAKGRSLLIVIIKNKSLKNGLIRAQNLFSAMQPLRFAANAKLTAVAAQTVAFAVATL